MHVLALDSIEPSVLLPYRMRFAPAEQNIYKLQCSRRSEQEPQGSQLALERRRGPAETHDEATTTREDKKTSRSGQLSALPHSVLTLAAWILAFLGSAF